MDAGAPLAAVRVLEIGSSIAGPYCGLLLAALGAEVVKLEPRTGDDTRSWGPPFWHGESAAFLAMNAGKRSLAVDLRHPAGAEIARRLAVETDVVLQNLRPKLADELGLGFETLAEISNRLIYCSISSFGSEGPLASLPGYDPLMQATAGIMSVTGEPDGPPVRAGVSLVDQGAGMWALIGILAALRLRDNGHRAAQLVETSLYETAVNWLPYQIVGYLASGTAPGRHGSGISILAPYQTFQCTDGEVMIAAGNDRLFARLCVALQSEELIDDPRFLHNRDRVANRDALAALLQTKLARRNSDCVIRQLRAAAVPVAPVADIQTLVSSEQLQALRLLKPLPNEDVPELQLVQPALRFDQKRPSWQQPPPRLGADGRKLLARAGYNAHEIDALHRGGVVTTTADGRR